MTTAHPELEGLGNYEYGWSDSNDAGSNAKRGLSEEVVRDISSKKSEPQWMLDLRLKGLDLFYKKPMPSWGSGKVPAPHLYQTPKMPFKMYCWKSWKTLTGLCLPRLIWLPI